MDIFQFTASPATCIICLIVAHLVLLGTYRLRFHPLKSHPGPVFAKLSGLYGAFYAYRKELHWQTLSDHARFGPVVRQGPNKLVFNTTRALHDIYLNDRVTKSRAYLVSQRAPDVYGVFNAIDKQMHQGKRKLVSQVVNERSLRVLEPIIKSQIDVFIHQLSLPGDSSSLDMTKMLRYLTMDIMGHIAFHYPFNLQTDPTHRSITDTTNANYLLNIALQLPFLVAFRAIVFPSLRALIRGKGYLKILETALRHRISQSHQSKHDLLYMTDTMGVLDDDEVSMEAMRNEAIFFLSAGSDTLSSTLSALFHYLSVNQRCYQRLAHEIRSTFANGSEIHSGPKLASCKYLRACIDESLRMCPPLPGTLWRQGIPDTSSSPLTVDGHHIPPGTEIGVNTYALHYNAEYFPEPYAFKPERWLVDDATAGCTIKAAFIPFSIGPRGCVGKAMAYLEASLVMAKTMWYFDFERTSRRPAGSVDHQMDQDGSVYQIKDMLVAEHDGPYLSFHSLRS
ncbi:cytochrome P450 [Nemania sp. NC0429]|nr:cytochrome P450 [Nemania sp. NC0429]